MLKKTLGAFAVAATLFAAPFAVTNLAAGPALADEVLGTATLERVRKSTSGTATLVRTDEGVFVEFSEDFSTGSGPDVLVLLHTSASPSSYDPSEYVSLGHMRTFNGAQRFAVPADVDVSQFESVVLWCRQFDVTFGAGALQDADS